MDLKIANAALREMADAFEVFAPFRHVPKVTIFGSARTLPDDPLYVQARSAARALADAGWMVVTGAGPGIMAAGQEGAGPGRSFGVNIRLPWEQGANSFIASDPKLVEMKYFFTRKLMLMKESDGFLVLPGGFGTLDEAYELLTLVQTGKAQPAPIVLLDVPDGTYWRGWERFVTEEVATRALISPEDAALYRITDNAAAAVEELLGFYRNYHSCRWVGDRLVLRLRGLPPPATLASLEAEFSDLFDTGGLEVTDALPAEVRGRDHLELPRLALRFNHRSPGRLRLLIDALNRTPGAPAEGNPPDR
ncbi:MAG TPA: TIGR00730 family Rossman fold protein [Acidimicrobiales bacterium]|nr:TIGR00730 family Rossman fold protein [Acidimicrobiales bacterium]